MPRRVTEHVILLSQTQLLEIAITPGPRVQIFVGQNWPIAMVVGGGASFPCCGSGFELVSMGGKGVGVSACFVEVGSRGPAHATILAR